MYTFNVRVYGILITPAKQVLVSDENIQGKLYRKFPGGGLEFGEGTIECLKREFLEELNTAIEVVDHFYTTDFFQESAFRKHEQIIAVYYLIKAVNFDSLYRQITTNGTVSYNTLSRNENSTELNLKMEIKNRHASNEFLPKTETFKFIELRDFQLEDIALPIDKVVAGLILARLNT